MTGPRTLAVDYDLYEVACLAGGPRRAMDAALVALVESGRVHVDRTTGQLSVGDTRRRHPVEAAVLDAIGSRGHRTVATVRWRLASDDRLTAVLGRLERDGLLRPSASSRKPRSWQAFALTGEGRRTLRHLRSHPPADRVADRTSAMQVALCGPDAMADQELRSALFEPVGPPPGRWLASWRRDPSAEVYVYNGHSAGAGLMFGGGLGGDCGGGGGGDGGGC